MFILTHALFCLLRLYIIYYVYCHAIRKRIRGKMPYPTIHVTTQKRLVLICSALRSPPLTHQPSNFVPTHLLVCFKSAYPSSSPFILQLHYLLLLHTSILPIPLSNPFYSTDRSRLPPHLQTRHPITTTTTISKIIISRPLLAAATRLRSPTQSLEHAESESKYKC